MKNLIKSKFLYISVIVNIIYIIFIKIAIKEGNFGVLMTTFTPQLILSIMYSYELRRVNFSVLMFNFIICFFIILITSISAVGIQGSIILSMVGGFGFGFINFLISCVVIGLYFKNKK